MSSMTGDPHNLVVKVKIVGFIAETKIRKIAREESEEGTSYTRR
jgi:hypothetical protein